MKTFKSLKYAAVLLPVFAMGISAATAEDRKCDCPCNSESTNVSAEKSHGKQGAEKAAMASNRAKAEARDRSEAKAKAALAESQYVASKRADDYFSGNLVGHDVMNRRDNKVVGTVNELLIDQNGQIGAVIVSTGGVMGLGKKELAIAWDQIERKVDGDNITLSVDFSDVSIVDAPKFARK